MINSLFELSVGQIIYYKHHTGRYSDRGWSVQEFTVDGILNDEYMKIRNRVEPQWVKGTWKHLQNIDWFLDKDECQKVVDKSNIFKK